MLGQVLRGRTAMPALNNTGFDAGYLLAACSFGAVDLAGRFDRFGVERGIEKGEAWTGSAHWNATIEDRLSVEYTRVEAKEAAPLRLSGGGTTDWAWLVNYRRLFGGRR